MRLYLLPISTRRTLIYAQRLNQSTTKQPSYIDKLTNRAAKTWLNWEQGTRRWQKNVVYYGNRALKRIPFEEWGLKSVPPLSTTERRLIAGAGAEAIEKNKDETVEAKPVEIIFPPSFIRPEGIIPLLKKLGTERQTLHRQRMWGSIALMPVSAPAALVPM